MKIYIGSDHAGYKLKNKLISHLLKLKHSAIDLGNLKYNKKDDYPIYAAKVARAVAKDKKSIGIIICGSGQGVSITANKIKGIRSAVAENIRDAHLARKDDDCNVLALSGRYLTITKAKRITNKFIDTKFERIPRRVRRLNEIKMLEK